MRIVTISSHSPKEPYYLYESFLASARKFGHEPLVLTENYGGLGTKSRMLRDAIQSGKVGGQIIFCDAWDCVFQSDPATINFNNSIRFNAEKHCFPDSSLMDKFPNPRTPYRYLNSGFAVGHTELFLQAINAMEPDELRVFLWFGYIKVAPELYRLHRGAYIAFE